MARKQFYIVASETRTSPIYGFTYERDTTVGNASTLKTAKAMISRFRRNNQEYNPMNFRIFDCWGEVDEKGFVPCVYQED